MTHRAIAAWLLLLVTLSVAQGDTPRTPESAFREAKKKLDAGELDQARELFQQATLSLNDLRRRRAFAHLIELTQRLELFDQTVREGQRYRRLVAAPADRNRWVEVTVQIGMAYEALAQYQLAERELLTARRALKEDGPPMVRLVLLARLARLAQVLHDPAVAAERWKTAETATVALIDDRRAKLSLHDRGAAVWLLAENYFRQQRHSEAIDRLSVLLAELEQGKNLLSQRVETLRRLSEHQEALDRFKEAAQSLCQAIRLYETIPDRDGLIRAELLDTLGDVFGKARLPLEAEKIRAEAGQAYLSVLKGSTSRTSPFSRSRAFWRMQRLYQKTHQYQRALLLIDDLTAPTANTPLIAADPRFKSKHAALHVFLGSYGQARGLFRDAVKTLQAGEPLNLIELPRALNSLAIVEQATDGLLETEKLGRRCLELYKRHRLPDDEILVETWNVLGTNAALMGRFKLGVQRFREGAALCKKLGPKADRMLSGLLLNQALLYRGQGDIALAREHLQQALDAYKRPEQPDSLGMALFECALASLHAEEGQYLKAFHMAQRVLERCRQYQIPGGPLVHTARHCLALGHMQRREYREAEKLWSQVRRAQEKAEENLRLPRTLNYLGMLAEIHDRREEAMTLYRQASAAQVKQARQTGISIPSTRFVTLWRIANLLNRQGQHTQARDTLMQAIEMVETVRQQTYGDAQQRTTFLAQYVPAFEQAFDWALRKGQVQEAFNLSARVRGRAFLDQLLLAGVDPRATLKGATGKELRRKEERLRQRLAGLRAQLTLLPGEARKKDRALRLVADLQQAQKDFAAVWREILNASELYSVLASEAVLTRPLAEVRKKCLPKGTVLLTYHLQRERAFAMLVTPGAREPEVFELKVPIDLLAELNRVMPSASAWDNTEPRGLALRPWGGRRSGRAARRNTAARRSVALRRRESIGVLPSAARLSSSTRYVSLSQPMAAMLVEHYRCLLEYPRFGTARGLKLVARDRGKEAVLGLTAYAEVLLPSALRQRLKDLAPRSVMVVPDGPLHKLPLEALLLQTEPRPRFVLDELPPLLYAPSVSALAYLAGRPALPKRTRSLLTVCDPAYAQSADSNPFGKPPAETPDDVPFLSPALTGVMPRLPFTAEESRRIRRHFPDALVTVLEGKQATEERVRAAMGKHTMIHIAAHGFADERFGNLFGALALAPPAAGEARTENDGLLELNEIYRLPLSRCDLAVLSACETNVGPQAPLEAGVTVASGFLAAGARCVVASHWSVDDRSTADLMSALFEEIMSRSSSTSYSQALQQARKRLRNRDRTASPFYWAPFVLIGVEGQVSRGGQ